MKKPEILIVTNTNSTFVRRDVTLLSVDYEVAVYFTGQRRDFFGFIGGFLKNFFFHLFSVWRKEAIFCWFADYHSFVPALFAKLAGKRFFLIEGGYDTTYLPEYDYGVFSTLFRSFCARFAMRRATLNLPVSNFLKTELPDFARVKAEVVPTGYDPKVFKPLEKRHDVISLAVADSEKRLKIKGVDRVLAVAALTPEINYRIIGLEASLLKTLEIPENVEILGKVNENEIVQAMGSSKVCTVFSVREGLPNVVFEAMLSECAVIGLAHSGLAEAIGEHGTLLKEWNVERAATAIRQKLAAPGNLRAARQYVVDNYSLAHRYQKITNLLKTTK